MARGVFGDDAGGVALGLFDVYGHRALTSTDGMTADSYPFPHHFRTCVSTRIINKVRGINHVCYDVTFKPPGTIE
mgnify:CR=1 FL=1